MPNIKEVSDGGADPNTPTVSQMKESQHAGSVGKGTSKEDYAETMACYNHGTGKGGKQVETESPEDTSTGFGI